MRDSRWPRGTWTAPGSLPWRDLLGLADVDDRRRRCRAASWTSRGIDLVDLALDLADELGAGRAHGGKLLKRGRDFGASESVATPRTLVVRVPAPGPPRHPPRRLVRRRRRRPSRRSPAATTSPPRDGAFRGRASARPASRPPTSASRDQDGRDGDARATSTGRSVVVTFLYTTCEDTCPLDRAADPRRARRPRPRRPGRSRSPSTRRATRPRARGAFLAEQRADRPHALPAPGPRDELRRQWRAYGIQPPERRARAHRPRRPARPRRASSASASPSTSSRPRRSPTTSRCSSAEPQPRSRVVAHGGRGSPDRDPADDDHAPAAT